MKKIKKEKNKAAKNKGKAKISPNEFVWTPKLSVNEETMDSQHKRLLDYINKLVKELSRGAGADLRLIRETIDFLGKYAQEHFSYEEGYMKKIKYPGFDRHKKIHKDFVKFYEKYKGELKLAFKSKTFLSGGLLKLAEKAKKFLGEWLVNHIGIEDHKYAEYAMKNLHKLTKVEKKEKDEQKPEKPTKTAKFNMSSIKAEIESELKSGKIKENEAQILEQRAPVKSISKLELKEKKSEKGRKEYIKTGISGFDELFENGIPKGNSVIVAGGAGSGKTIFGLQIFAYHASQGKKCFYMSFEESEDRLKQHMKDFGWDTEKMIKSGKLRIQRTSPFEITRNVDALLAKEKGELLIDIEPVLLPKDFKPDFIVVDSLTAIASAFTGKENSYRVYIEQLFRFFEKIEATTFLITETKQIPEIFSTTGVEEFLADGVIVLYNIKRGDIRENAIEVLKMRGEKHQKKIVAMTISDSGITVYPEQEVFGGLGEG
jgi:hemerythrin-like metal-binding protein